MLPKLTIREKEICHISVESVMCKELEQQATDEYISILKTVTNFNITLNTLGSYILDCPINSLEETLIDLKHFGYKVAVVWAEGSWPVEPDIDEEILKSVDEWNNNKWGCAGHILDRNNNPQFHHQCIIINLAEFKFLKRGDLYEYEASTEHLHDDYTPKWIKPKANAHRVNGIDRVDGLFNSFLRTSIDQGLMIYNLDYNIRGNKVCIYPEDDIEWAENEIFKKYTDMKNVYDIKENYPDKKPLFELKVQEFTNVYVTNTEMAPDVDVNDLQVIVCPCSGLHQFKYMEKSLDVLETVIWADFSYYAVKWMKIVINEWNGRDFNTFFEANKHRLDFNGSYVYGHGTWEKFLDSFDSEEAWLKIWNRIRNLEHQFEVINIVEESDKVVELIPHNKNVLLQCSNIFLYESNYFTKGLDTTFKAISYLRNVQSISNKVYVNGDINGHFYDMTNIGRQKWI